VDTESSEKHKAGRSTAPGEGAAATRFYRQLMIAAMTVVLLAGLVYLLDKFGTVLQQLLTAGFVAYIILPIQRWLVRAHVPPALAYLLIVAAILGLGLVVGLAVQENFADLTTKLPGYQKNFTQLVERLSKDIPELDDNLIRPLLHRESASVDEGMKNLRRALNTLAGFLSQAFVVLIYLIFILAEQAGVQQRIGTAFGPERAPHIRHVIEQVNNSIAEYLSVKTLMSVLGGVLTVVVLYAFGVDYPILWGVIAFLLNYIPYLGSLAATVLPVLLAVVQFQSLGYALLLLAVLAVVQNGIGYGIEPFVAGSRLNLSPLVIILALAFWGALWGIVGMILAVPLVVTIKIILENIPATRPLAILMSHGAGRSP
jgi:AI-2 transport protein TqsA